MAPMGKI